MPWDYKKTSDGNYEVYNKITGKSNGVSESKQKALDHIKALYANASPEEMQKEAVKRLTGY